MNICNKYTALLLLAVMLFQACATPGAARRAASEVAVEELSISALGGVGVVEAPLLDANYAGSGGRAITLAVLLPHVHGAAPGTLPHLIQGRLNNNINRFSAITVVDHIHLEQILAAQALAEGQIFDQRNYIRAGYLAVAQYQLHGTILRIAGDRYSLDLRINNIETGVSRATFVRGEITRAQIEGRGTLLNEASAELLEQMGVQLTSSGRQRLLAGDIAMIQAEAGVARARIAGSEVTAMLNFAHAVSFDPGQFEAAARLNTLTTTIGGGTISERILTDFQMRDEWLDAFRETTSFFNDHPPFEIIFDPNLRQIGETDFRRRTVNLGMNIVLQPSASGFRALNSLLEGLDRTGRRDAWGFSGWPLMDVSPRTAGTVVFSGRQSFRYTVDVRLVNENGITLGNSSITLDTPSMGFSAGDRRVTPPANVYGVVDFPNIRAEDLTPTLTVEILAVNRIRAHDLVASSYIRVEPGDLELRAIRAEVAERRAQELQRQERQRRRSQFAGSLFGVGVLAGVMA